MSFFILHNRVYNFYGNRTRRKQDLKYFEYIWNIVIDTVKTSLGRRTKFLTDFHCISLYLYGYNKWRNVFAWAIYEKICLRGNVILFESMGIVFNNMILLNTNAASILNSTNFCLFMTNQTDRCMFVCVSVWERGEQKNPVPSLSGDDFTTSGTKYPGSVWLATLRPTIYVSHKRIYLKNPASGVSHGPCFPYS